MKLTVQQVMDVTLVISQILRDQNGNPRDDGSVVPRPMPQKGRYRLTRMHTKLTPEFKTINEQRDELIKAYDHKEGENYAVPVDKMAEFTEAWKKIADEEIEVDVEPIPFDQLDLGNNVDGCLTPQELFILAPVIKD